MSWFVVSGGLIFCVLGFLHAVVTVQSKPDRGPLTPRDPRVREAMQIRGGLGLAPRLDSTLWRAWVGFNLSHSLGAIVSGAVIALPAWLDFQAALSQPWWVATALILPPIYLVMSVRYWFRKPTLGIAFGFALVVIGIVGALTVG